MLPMTLVLAYLTCLTGLTSTAIATPTTIERSTPQASWCIDRGSAEMLASRYADLLSAFTPAKAEAVLTADFTETSDSINLLSGKPLGTTPTYASREEFIAAQQQRDQPAPAQMDIDSVLAVTCDAVVVRWIQHFIISNTTSSNSSTVPVVAAGVSVLGAAMRDDDWRVASVVMEFNSAAYIRCHGGVCL
ncbi:hypothetical protein F5Y01DRAFT_299463 [Xylaria sp. FL0043]|nr:hypothetical protein F5Y01DRAFT_299463 [Xylaria sp. FL0043]